MNDFDSTTAAEATKYLDSVSYPASKEEIVSEASSQAASPEVVDLISQLPSRQYSTRQEAASFFETIAKDQLMIDEDEAA